MKRDTTDTNKALYIQSHRSKFFISQKYRAIDFLLFELYRTKQNTKVNKQKKGWKNMRATK